MVQSTGIISKNGKWGITGNNGEILFEPIYDHIRYVKNTIHILLKKT